MFIFEFIRFIFIATTGLFSISWLISLGAWNDLAEKYRTDDSLPRTFFTTENQHITFKRENKSGVSSFDSLGVGVSDQGLYLSYTASLPDLFNFFPALLIPWSDIAYRKITSANSSRGYYTFYLGKPRIIRFSLNADTIDKLETEYGESIFVNKLGEPELSD